MQRRRFNAARKVVASRTLTEAPWGDHAPATVVDAVRDVLESLGCGGRPELEDPNRATELSITLNPMLFRSIDWIERWLRCDGPAANSGGNVRAVAGAAGA